MPESSVAGKPACAGLARYIVLVSDDDRDVLDAIRDRRGSIHANVLHVGDTAQVAERLKQQRPDMVLVPEDPDGHSHVDLCRLARQVDPSMATVVLADSPGSVLAGDDAVDGFASLANHERLLAQVNMLLALRAYNLRSAPCRNRLADELKAFGLNQRLLRDGHLLPPGRVEANALIRIGETDHLMYSLCSAYGVVYSLYHLAAEPRPVENWQRRAAAQHHDLRPLCGCLQQLNPIACARAQWEAAREAFTAQRPVRCPCWAGMTLLGVPIGIRFRGASNVKIAAVFELGDVPEPEQIAALGRELDTSPDDLLTAATLSRAWRPNLAVGLAQREQHLDRVCRAVEALADNMSLVLSDKYATAYNILAQAVERWEHEHAIGHKTMQLEQARQKLREVDRLRSEFLANMSHELRTPITSILGFSSLLLSGKPLPDERRSHYLRRIDASSRDLASLVDNLLDLSRLMTTRPELHIEPCSVDEIVEDCLGWVRPRAEHKPLELRAAACGLEVRTDPGKLRQILLNLLANAVKFAETGYVEVTAAARSGGDGAGWLRLSVADTGVGISPERMEGLFEEFRQGNGSLSRSFGGAGIGLALVKRLAHLLGGTVSVQSAVGKGSVFTAELPLDLERHHEQQQQVRCRLMEEERQRPEIPAGRALLVIDSDPATAVQLREWLEPDVLPVAVETDPDAGLRRARTLRPAAIILDVMSPYGDNWDLVAALNTEPATCEVPVVIASAIENRHFAWALGAQGYIVKPLDRAAVFGALAEIGLVNEPLAAGQPR